MGWVRRTLPATAEAREAAGSCRPATGRAAVGWTRALWQAGAPRRHPGALEVEPVGQFAGEGRGQGAIAAQEPRSLPLPHPSPGEELGGEGRAGADAEVASRRAALYGRRGSRLELDELGATRGGVPGPEPWAHELARRPGASVSFCSGK